MIEAQALAEDLKKTLSEKVGALEGAGLDAVLYLDTSGLRPAMERLKNDHGFNMLVDLTALDFSAHPQKAKLLTRPDQRFKLVYRFLSLDTATGLLNGRIALASWLHDDAGPVSVRDLWPNADWLEREVWDMFGIKFAGRPDIKRILLYEEFKGHPLRKDYPIAKRQPLIGPKEEKPRDRMLEGDLRPKVA